MIKKRPKVAPKSPPSASRQAPFRHHHHHHSPPFPASIVEAEVNGKSNSTPRPSSPQTPAPAQPPHPKPSGYTTTRSPPAATILTVAHMVIPEIRTTSDQPTGQLVWMVRTLQLNYPAPVLFRGDNGSRSRCKWQWDARCEKVEAGRGSWGHVNRNVFEYYGW